MLIKGLSYADGIENQFYGYQMADLGGHACYQAKLSNMPSLRRWYSDRDKLVNTNKHYDRYKNECIVFKYSGRITNFTEIRQVISFGKEYSLKKENSKKNLETHRRQNIEEGLKYT